jgi:hypothetical protein
VTAARALYVYAVVPGATRLGEVWGVGNEPVEVLAQADLGVVVSDVDVGLLEEVNDATDAASLGTLAQRHHAVVREVAGASKSLLPFRLGTLVPDRDAARRYLVDSAGVLAPALRRVDSCREWGVTVYEGRQERAAREPEPSPTESSGTAYLLRRRQEIAQEQDLRRARARAGTDVHTALVAHVVDSTAGRSRREGVLVCKNYLVREEAEPAFFQAVDRSGDDLLACGLRLEVSGPWPPYSFAHDRLGDLETSDAE